MNRTIRTCMAVSVVISTMTATAQTRYLDEVFTDEQLVITKDVTYGTNIDFLTSDLSSPDVPTEVGQLQTLVAQGQPIPPEFFDPSDASTALKVTNGQMDIYEPHQYIDCESARPLVIYLHTGNALPPPLNGSPLGQRTDSIAVEVCSRMARRGYVAASMTYRKGWNPLGATLQERRGTLLNAIYRAVHDLRQCVRFMKEDASIDNNYGIDVSKIIVFGEGTGGYIALGNATLDDPAELFIEKFRPDPFDPDVSYVDTTQVGNLDGFGGALNLYQPNGFDHSTHFCVNLGGALADTSWLEPGDVPMVPFQGIFDPFAPFTDGIVIVPTTGEQVVPVQGANHFMELVNQYGNNASITGIPSGDPYTDRARSLYGTTHAHSGSTVDIRTNVEGLFPTVTPDWPAMVPGTFEEASPWQWWDPNSPLATAVVNPGPPPITAHQASLASNPNMSATKARAYIDTIMGYLNPRIVMALSLPSCTVTAMDCAGTVNGDVLPGDDCDDGDPNTVDDVYDENCTCAGLVVDCNGVAGGPDLPGEPCDDNDPNTINDMWDTNCMCAGVPIGIEENSEIAQGVSVFPNPANERVTIKSDAAEILSYEMQDVSGRVVRSASANANIVVIEREALDAGTYMISLRYNEGVLTRRVTLN